MLKGRTVIVTGGSRGIGAAITEKFASMGANVAVIYAGNQTTADTVCEKAELNMAWKPRPINAMWLPLKKQMLLLPQ